MITNVNELFLRHSKDRAKLLRAGFSGREIESLYLVLNSFELVGVNWQPAGV
ncbi:MAG: hypothetical protein KKA10_16190 [Euryarchaeota archaeon]|nr:hypothetical protein [Euryarchaeota archaeon]